MPKTILLADDSVTIQKVVGISFANEDVVLLTVDNGDDAVTQAQESRPDIVLADIVMPGKSGYEVCEALRSDPNLRDIPVLLLSGTFETFDENRAQEVGANGHITKPFEAQALVDRVNELLEAGAAGVANIAHASDTAMGGETNESGASQSGSQAYDFFDEEMPSLSPEPSMAETALIGVGAPGDSVSGQVFDLEPMEESAAPAVSPTESSFDPSSPVAEPDIPVDARPEDVFGSSFAAEEPLAESSAFSLEESPELAEAAEAFAHPDSLDPPRRPEPDPLTTPTGSAADSALEAPDLSDEALAQGVSQGFDATEVHRPIAGDDLYDGFAGADSPFLFEENEDAEAAFQAAPEATGDSKGAGLAEPPQTIAYDPNDSGAPSWDEDPESLSQSALEPLPEFADVPVVAEPALPAEPMASGPEAGDREPENLPTSIPVASPEPVSVPQIPAELQERMHATLERVAWEAMGDLSERVIKETLGRIESIAWEVIPQMAETMIREELERIKDSEE